MTLYQAFTNWLEQRAYLVSNGQSIHRQIVALALDNPQAYIKYIADNSNSALIIVPEAELSEPIFRDCISQNSSVVAVERYRTLLGNQTEILVFDARHGINLDALVAASGLITASGILLLILPCASFMNKHQENEQIANKFKNEYPLNNINTFVNKGIPYSFTNNEDTASSFSLFYPLFIKNLEKSEALCVDNDSLPSIFSASQVVAISSENKKQILNSQDVKLSEQQKKVLQAVCNVNNDTKVHVVLGKRGRGKTTLLAAICAAATQSVQLIVSAPNKTQLTIFEKYLNEQNSATFQFIAPDQVEHFLRERSAQNKPQHASKQQWLLVDEVASIAPSLLKQMLVHCDKAIIAGTTQGYEGSGLGFIHRVLPYLQNAYKCDVYELTKAFRWYPNDPIEAFFEDLLGLSQTTELLEAKVNLSVSDIQTNNFLSANPTIRIQQINKRELIKNKLLYQALVSLLREAHYQTTANDIVRLLDAPEQTLIVAIDTQSRTNKLCALCILIHEGGEVLQALAQEIASGQRRVQGHMSPQALALHILKPSLCQYTCLRVNRIAVNDAYRRKGLGSDLLNYCEQYARRHNINYLSTSYGFTTPLHQFWKANSFHLVKLGNRIDTSSGTRSALMIKNLSIPNGEVLINTLRKKLHMDDIYLHEFYSFPRSSVSEVNESNVTANSQNQLAQHKSPKPTKTKYQKPVLTKALIKDNFDSDFSYMVQMFIDGKVALNLAASPLWAYIVNTESSQYKLESYFRQFHEKGLHKSERNALQARLRDELKTLYNSLN